MFSFYRFQLKLIHPIGKNIINVSKWNFTSFYTSKPRSTLWSYLWMAKRGITIKRKFHRMHFPSKLYYYSYIYFFSCTKPEAEPKTRTRTRTRSHKRQCIKYIFAFTENFHTCFMYIPANVPPFNPIVISSV